MQGYRCAVYFDRRYTITHTRFLSLRNVYTAVNLVGEEVYAMQPISVMSIFKRKMCQQILVKQYYEIHINLAPVCVIVIMKGL